jgi:hypothetical protein
MPVPKNSEEQGTPVPLVQDPLFQKEGELLTRVREIAQQIADRVSKALGIDPSELPPPDPNENR